MGILQAGLIGIFAIIGLVTIIYGTVRFSNFMIGWVTSND